LQVVGHGLGIDAAETEAIPLDGGDVGIDRLEFRGGRLFARLAQGGPEMDQIAVAHAFDNNAEALLTIGRNDGGAGFGGAIYIAGGTANITNTQLKPRLNSMTRHGICQSTSFNPNTRLNSDVLWVTSVRSLANAIAAIIKSFGPMVVPLASRSARTWP